MLKPPMLILSMLTSVFRKMMLTYTTQYQFLKKKQKLQKQHWFWKNWCWIMHYKALSTSVMENWCRKYLYNIGFGQNRCKKCPNIGSVRTLSTLVLDQPILVFAIFLKFYLFLEWTNHNQFIKNILILI